MIVIVVFVIVGAAAVGFFELLEWHDPSRDRRRHRRPDEARLDALERAVLDREAGSANNEPPGTTI